MRVCSVFPSMMVQVFMSDRAPLPHPPAERAPTMHRLDYCPLASPFTSDEERRADEDCTNALSEKLSRVTVGAGPDSEDHERALREAVHSIRAEQPGMVAKQVHAALQERGEQWASTTISEVRRMCSELAKVEVQLNLQALSTPEKAAEQLDEVLSDPLNAEAMKVARPGLPTNSTTLRGDRLGTRSPRRAH